MCQEGGTRRLAPVVISRGQQEGRPVCVVGDDLAVVVDRGGVVEVDPGAGRLTFTSLLHLGGDERSLRYRFRRELRQDEVLLRERGGERRYPRAGH
jgi:hypothetical protein